jgi:hypothetical protein
MKRGLRRAPGRLGSDWFCEIQFFAYGGGGVSHLLDYFRQVIFFDFEMLSPISDLLSLAQVDEGAVGSTPMN